MTDDQIQTLRLVKGYHATKRNSILGTLDGQIEAARHGAAVDAIDAALALASRTCGNCGHWRIVPYRGRIKRCVNASSIAFDAITKPADGCRLGWVAKP